MRRLILLVIFGAGVSVSAVRGEGLEAGQSKFYYKKSTGQIGSARIIRRYWGTQIVHPFAKIDPRIDPKLRRAATFAEERANARSKARCWHYVKEALVAAHVISSYPKTAYAAEAGDELMRDYGFRKLSMHDPYAAPLGSVIVYGNRNRGHVEIRTKDGFVSDYHSKNRCAYPVRAVYAKFSS